MIYLQSAQILLDEYGIETDKIGEAPRGFVAETFKIATAGRKYFLKKVKIGRLSHYLKQSSEVLAKIQTGLNISQIVKTKTGRNYVENAEYIYVLYDWIEGQSLSCDNLSLQQKQNFYSLLKQIHSLPIPTITIETEKFKFLGEKSYLESKQKLANDNLFGVQKILQSYLNSYQTEIDQLFTGFKIVQAKCRQKSVKNFVITHGDVLNNLIINENQVCLIDWDDILLAPKERDLWGIEEFFTELDQDYYFFYLYQRFLDLTDWLEIILDNSNSEETKMQNFEEMRKDCFETWLLPLIREKLAILNKN